MKIALIRQRYNAFGGAERFVDQAMAAIAIEGSTDVTLVTRDWNSAQPDRKVIRCNPFHIGRTWRDWGFANAACAATRSGFDLVQSHERIACCDIYRAGDGVHAQWLENRARTISAARRLATTVSPWHRYTLAAERRLFTSARLRAVICNSQMVANEIRSRFGVADDKLKVIYNGVDAQRFHPRLKPAARQAIRARLGIPDEALVHLYVGSGFERKGVPQLIQAMRGARQHMHLVIVGADRKSGIYQSQAASAGLGGQVHFAGPQKDIEHWYAMADCFVLPTLYDPFPNAIMEAMASGLPVITSTQCGAAELVGPGQCGWICDALDVATLGRFLRELTPATAADMGSRARALAERFTPENMADQLTALYRNLSGTDSHTR